MDFSLNYSYLISEIKVEPDDNGKSEKSCIVIKEEEIDDDPAFIACLGQSSSQNESSAIDNIKAEPASPNKSASDVEKDSTFHPRDDNVLNETVTKDRADIGDWLQDVLNKAGANHEYHKVNYTKRKLKTKQPEEVKNPKKDRKPTVDNTVKKLVNNAVPPGKDSIVIEPEGKYKRSSNPTKIRKKIECKICFRIYGSKSTLSCHLNQHINGKVYVCPICGISFQRLSAIIRHRTTHTSSEKQVMQKNKNELQPRKTHVECKVCGKKIQHLRNMKVKILFKLLLSIAYVVVINGQAYIWIDRFE